jgi:hypothetical protein
VFSARTRSGDVSQKSSFENISADRAGWRPDVAYDELPTLPPTHDLETRRILKACIEARVAVVELKQAAELIPNQVMLINTIPRLEAKHNSEIGNIVTTTDKLSLPSVTTGSRPSIPSWMEMVAPAGSSTSCT